MIRPETGGIKCFAVLSKSPVFFGQTFIIVYINFLHLFILNCHGSRKIAAKEGVNKVELNRKQYRNDWGAFKSRSMERLVGYDEGKNGILHEVVEGSTSELVESHQITVNFELKETKNNAEFTQNW